MTRKINYMPAAVLVLMSQWWLLPSLFGYLIRYPISEHAVSYNLYWINIAVTVIVSVMITVAEFKRNKWVELTITRKYFFVYGYYCINMVAIFSLTAWLGSIGVLGYFGGDAGGSIGMAYIPSILGYLVIGLIIGIGEQISGGGSSTDQ